MNTIHLIIDPPGQSKYIGGEHREEIKIMVSKSDLESFFQKSTLSTKYLGDKGVIMVIYPKIARL